MTLAANHTLYRNIWGKGCNSILYLYGGYLLGAASTNLKESQTAHLPQTDYQCEDVSSVSHKYLQDFGKIAVCVLLAIGIENESKCTAVSLGYNVKTSYTGLTTDLYN